MKFTLRALDAAGDEVTSIADVGESIVSELVCGDAKLLVLTGEKKLTDRKRRALRHALWQAGLRVLVLELPPGVVALEAAPTP